MAEEKGLYLVQMCKENHYFPKVIAAPSECRKEEQLAKNESLDFEQYCFDGNFLWFFFCYKYPEYSFRKSCFAQKEASTILHSHEILLQTSDDL